MPSQPSIPHPMTTRRLEPELADIAALEPVRRMRRRWPMVVGAVLTIAMVVMLGRELLGSGLAGLDRAVPDSPWFYLFFALTYLSAPTGDYVIFRRLWGIPFDGFVALNKKRIANDVVLGYSGEAYFYAWARARATMVAAPFGAVKDVSLLSAIAGNAATILLCALALPLGYRLLTPGLFNTILGSVTITIAISVTILAFSRRVFSLPAKTLRWIFSIHALRLLAGSVFVAFAWHFAMPGVSVFMWLFLAAGRLLVSRLPLVPNKDLLFANFAILLIGQDQSLSGMIAFFATLTLIVHIALIGVFGLADIVTRGLAWRVAR